MRKTAVKDRLAISQYYHDLNTDVHYIETFSELFALLGTHARNAKLFSSNRAVRGVLARLRFLHLYVENPANIIARCQQYHAFKDALLLLARKNIPVYFYNRVGKEKEGFVYSESATIRMEKGLSFPLMYENIDTYKEEFKELFGNQYSKEYVEKIGRIPQVIRKGDVYCHEDLSSEYVNVVGGRRVTCYQPRNTTRTIHFYGRCGAFGYAVEDKDTLPSQLQRCLVEGGQRDISVINHGLWGGEDSYIDHNFISDAVGMKEGEIVLFYRMHLDKRMLRHLQDYGLRYKEITHEWHKYPEAKWCFYDKPGHMNSVGYGIVAKLIFDDLMENGFSALPVNEEKLRDFKSAYLTEYLKSRRNPEFYKEISNYIQGIEKEFPLTSGIVRAGAIVMNCNPFTKGHRFLIEQAVSKVDRLYIFVVEEDKSYFRFSDRKEMVVKGTEDLPNVVVVSSGKFIISSYTFPEYFMKDYVKEKNFDVTNDLEIFCEYIAPPLRIRVRFAGEEPFDPVTSNYNENMRRILPKYGMEFCEIPRLALNKGTVINATEVRRLLKDGDLESIKEYVPSTTLKILKERYLFQ